MVPQTSTPPQRSSRSLSRGERPRSRRICSDENTSALPTRITLSASSLQKANSTPRGLKQVDTDA